MVAAYQYPRQLTGRPCVCSHQVVIRGADLHATDTAVQREQAWLECLSDLHTDNMNGSMGPLGCMTQYICTRHPDAQTKGTCQSCSYRDLVVYPNVCGGKRGKDPRCPTWLDMSSVHAYAGLLAWWGHPIDR